jgi:hypothetical protein
MQEIETAWQLEEVHRFFPEWADRPPSPESPPEFDRNSYMAGGYSEEFGHRGVPVDSPLAEEPERCPEWKVQAGGLHPGYPECPRPVDRDRGRAVQQLERALRAEPGFGGTARNSGMKTIQVGHRTAHGWLTARLTLLWIGIRARRRDLGGIV